MNMDFFQDLYSRVDPAADDLTFDAVAEFAKDRFHQSISNNPDFYYGPVTGMIARNAGYLFTARIFRNHSSENPTGVLCMFPSYTLYSQI